MSATRLDRFEGRAALSTWLFGILIRKVHEQWSCTARGCAAVMTMMMYYVAPMMMGMEMDIAAMLGSLFGGSWAAGMVLHFVLGCR